MDTTEQKVKCSCPCHSMIGVLVALFGLTFLLGALQVLSERAVSVIWPIVVILAGLQKAFGRMCKCCSGGCCKK